jgi:hypothetical protein
MQFLKQFDKERQKEEDDYIRRRVGLQGEVNVHTSIQHLIDFIVDREHFLIIPEISIRERVKVHQICVICYVLCLYDVE